MNLLLDTHAFLWWSLDPSKLPPTVLNELQNPENRIVFSVVSSWEAQIKIGLGKLKLEDPLQRILEKEIIQNNWEVLPVTLQHTWKLGELPPLHRDPFDRLLLAQSLVENLTLVSGDSLILNYPAVKTLWF